MTQYYYGNLSPSRRQKTRKNKDILRTKQAMIQVKFRAELNLKTCRIFTLPDPGLEIRRGSVIHTLRKGGRRSPMHIVARVHYVKFCVHGGALLNTYRGGVLGLREAWFK